MNYKTTVLLGLGILILELIGIGVWFARIKPDSEAAMDLFYVVPILFGINLVLGGILYFIRKPLGLVFFANSVLCPIIFYASWIMWFTYWA